MAESAHGHPVIATVQHKKTTLASSTKGGIVMKGRESETAAYGIFIYSLIDWKIMYPGDVSC